MRTIPCATTRGDRTLHGTEKPSPCQRQRANPFIGAALCGLLTRRSVLLARILLQKPEEPSPGFEQLQQLVCHPLPAVFLLGYSSARHTEFLCYMPVIEQVPYAFRNGLRPVKLLYHQAVLPGTYYLGVTPGRWLLWEAPPPSPRNAPCQRLLHCEAHTKMSPMLKCLGISEGGKNPVNTTGPLSSSVMACSLWVKASLVLVPYHLLPITMSAVLGWVSITLFIASTSIWGPFSR